MSRPRGGNTETRRNRSVECQGCMKCLRASEAGQMLRFNYLCGDCTNSGYRIKLFPVEGSTPPRQTVRVTRDGTIVR